MYEDGTQVLTQLHRDTMGAGVGKLWCFTKAPISRAGALGWCPDSSDADASETEAEAVPADM